jgi:hypothetical protein
MTQNPSSSSSTEKLDLRVVLEIPLGQFIPWLVTVLLVTWAGYPGVACATPVAWLIALRVGILCAARSRSTQLKRRLQEAVLAGGWFGLLQGYLFLVIVPRMGPIHDSEQNSANGIILAMIAIGMLAGAGLSFFTAYQIERRRKNQQ